MIWEAAERRRPATLYLVGNEVTAWSVQWIFSESLFPAPFVSVCVGDEGIKDSYGLENFFQDDQIYHHEHIIFRESLTFENLLWKYALPLVGLRPYKRLIAAG